MIISLIQFACLTVGAGALLAVAHIALSTEAPGFRAWLAVNTIAAAGAVCSAAVAWGPRWP